MNICLIPSAELSYESGSTLYAQNYVNYLSKMGHQVYTICSDLPRVRDENVRYIVIDIMEHPVIDDYPVSNSRMWDSINKIVKTILDIQSEGIKFDVVHAHYATINAIAAGNIKILTGVPYIISCFGRDIFNGSKNDQRYARMVEVSLAGANYVLCSNTAIKDKVINMMGVTKNRIKVLPMPVDTNIFSVVQNAELRKKQVLTALNVVSSFSVEKGIETTIKAISIIMQQGYAICIHILGADEHPEKKNYNKYKEFISRFGLEKVVRLEGRVQNDKVAEWLKKVDVVIDSRYVGNYSSIILESLAMGKAIIASDVEGNKEFISDGINGLLYKINDENDLALKLRFLIDHPNTFENLENNAKKWFEKEFQNYSFENHTEAIVNIYKDICDKH